MSKFLSSIMLVLCLTAQASALRVAMVVGSDTTKIARDTLLRNDLRNYLGYTVRVVPQEFVKDSSASFWTSNFDGVLICQYYSGMEPKAMTDYGVNLRDVAIPIVTLHRTSYDEFRLATNPAYIAVAAGGTTGLKRMNSTHWVSKALADTLIFSWSIGRTDGLFAWYNLAAGATNLYSLGRQTTPAWNGDTTMMMVVDSGAYLTSGRAAERRAMFAGFSPLEMDYDCLPPGVCHWVSAFRRLCAWTFHDTANVFINSNACLIGEDEVEFCWTEGGRVSGLTPWGGRQTYTNQRSSVDNDAGDNHGKMFGFTKLQASALKRKLADGYQIDSIRIMRRVADLACNSSHTCVRGVALDSFDISEVWHPVSLSKDKWWCPCYSSWARTCDGCVQADYFAGLYDDSMWVNRVNVRGVDPTSGAIPWTAVDLSRGDDYDTTVIDSNRYNPASIAVGDSVFTTISGTIAMQWIDSATNNGMVSIPEDHTGNSGDYDIEVCFGDMTEIEATAKRGRVDVFMSQVTVADSTPSIRMAAYVCGADNISADSVFMRAAGDSSTFIARYENMIGLGQGMEGYAKQMWQYAPNGTKSFYISPNDMPAQMVLPTEINNGIKYNFLTKGMNATERERLYMHYYDSTSAAASMSGPWYHVNGTGHCYPIHDADSVNRIFHYAASWGGNTYTSPTRPIFNMNLKDNRDLQRDWIDSIFNGNNSTYFPSADTCFPTDIYCDNYDQNRFASWYLSHETRIADFDYNTNCLFNSFGTTTTNRIINHVYFDTLTKFIREVAALTVTATGRHPRVIINMGSSNWNDNFSYINYHALRDSTFVPAGTVINWEYGFDLLMLRGQSGNWLLDSLAKADSAACAQGITYMYCAAPFDRQGNFYRDGTWNYHGFSQAAWSVYMRMIAYLACRSDSTMFYPMPDYYHSAYQGYAFDHPTLSYGATYWDWSGDSAVSGDKTQSFDTLSWQPCLKYDLGKAQGMPYLVADTTYKFPLTSDTWHAKVWRRNYENGAYLLVRPYDHGDVRRWGAVADTSTGGSRDLTLNMSLGGTYSVLLPDGTLSVLTYTEYPLNPAEGYVFIPAGYVPPASRGTQIKGLKISGTRID